MAGKPIAIAQGLTKVPRYIPRPAFRASFSVATQSFEYRRYATAQPAETNLRPMSTPLGEKTWRPCRSRLTTSQRTLTPAIRASTAANDIVPRAIC
jgi:hypothetical protein